MILKIDTSNSDATLLAFGGKQYQSESRQNKSQNLLPFLVECLTAQNKKITDITAIEVNCGPGSFTGLRVGISVANALAWTLAIPVNGKKSETSISY